MDTVAPLGGSAPGKSGLWRMERRISGGEL